MSFAATMAPNKISVSWGDEDHVDPVYDLSSVDPLALMIWWRADETTWGSDTYPPDGSIMVQRLQTIATEGADSFEKLFPGIVSSLPEEYKEEARKTREYYINKFVQIGIRDEMPISPVRQAMFKALTNTKEMTTPELGLLSRIHDFYVEDQFVERLVDTAVSVEIDSGWFYHKIDQVYTVIGNNRQMTKNTKMNVWWMQGEDKTLLMLRAPTHITTNSLVEHMLPPGARWHIKCDTCAIRSLMGHRDFNTRVLTHGYKLSEAPDSA